MADAGARDATEYSILPAEDLPYCSSCNMRMEGLEKRCTACSVVLYCSIACQRTHWKLCHRKTCARLPTALRGTRWAPSATMASLDHECPIVTLSKKTTVGIGGVQSTLHVLPKSNFRDLTHVAHVTRPLEGRPYTAVDHILFAQVFLYATVTNHEDLPQNLAFGRTAESVWAVHARVSELQPNDAPSMVYLAMRDAETRNCLRSTKTLAYTMFLFGPFADGCYLGLAEAGPMRLPLEQWKKRVDDDAFSYMADCLEAQAHSMATIISGAMDDGQKGLVLFEKPV